jgi:hypothetical protein
MAKKIISPGGSKGGVGKTIVAMATIDYLHQRGENVILIETDTGNPDVWKAYKNSTETVLIDLDKANGWIDVINTCNDKPDHTIVINTAARSNGGVSAHGNMLFSTLPELKRHLVTLWVINTNLDSLELLKQYMGELPTSQEHSIHVIRNSYHGDESDFELYNRSKLRTMLEENGGKSLNFPVVAKRISDEFYNRRLSIAEAALDMPSGNHDELSRWRNEVKKMMEAVINE